MAVSNPPAYPLALPQAFVNSSRHVAACMARSSCDHQEGSGSWYNPQSQASAASMHNVYQAVQLEAVQPQSSGMQPAASLRYRCCTCTSQHCPQGLTGTYITQWQAVQHTWQWYAASHWRVASLGRLWCGA